jgi:tetratricopeptide (TPR) repeat protein
MISIPGFTPARFDRFSRLIAVTQIVLVAIALLMVPAPAFAQTAPKPGIGPSYVDDAALDVLFMELASATSQTQASAIADQIWLVWLNPGPPELAARMNMVNQARRMGDVSEAIRLLTQITVKFPSYAEAWNQRATLYFFLGNFTASLADVEQVLTREPRHFGALAGQANMYLQMGEKALALKAILAALRFHPYLSERALFEELIEPPIRI